MWIGRPACFAALIAALLGAGALAAAVPPIETPGRIESVTVHSEWVSVTRVASVELPAGLHEVRFTNLPVTIEPASIRADAGGRAVVTRVAYEEREDVSAYETGLSEKVRALEDARRQMAILDERLLVLAKEEGLLDAIAERTAQRSAEQVGSGRLDLDEITRVSKYLAEQHAALLERRRTVTADKQALQQSIDRLTAERVEYESAGPPLLRSAVLNLSIDEVSDPTIPLRLTYLASGVKSRVSYNVRTDPSLAQASLEFEVEVEQATGEDWLDVSFAFSTHPIVDPTAPPALRPGVIEPASSDGSSLALRQPVEEGTLLSGRASLARLVGQGGRVVSRGSLGSPPFTLYRFGQSATIPSGAGHGQRLRLNTFSVRPEFRYVAVPVISNSAFLRGTLENTSRVHWLPGPASVFLGSEYVGETTMPYVAPGSRVEIFFGTDHRVAAQRTQVSNRTRSTGLLGDGRETLVEYRIRITNATGQAMPVEVWDRAPMSRDDRITVSTTGFSPGLSRDEEFRLRQRSEGLLRWDIDLPASGRESIISYTLVVAHKAGVEVPVIPD